MSVGRYRRRGLDRWRKMGRGACKATAPAGSPLLNQGSVSGANSITAAGGNPAPFLLAESVGTDNLQQLLGLRVGDRLDAQTLETHLDRPDQARLRRLP